MEETYLEYGFTHKDQFGQIFEFKSTLTTAVLEDTELMALMGQFKNFLLSMGYPQNLIDKIVVND